MACRPIAPPWKPSSRTTTTRACPPGGCRSRNCSHPPPTKWRRSEMTASLQAPAPALVEDLVAANHILVDEGVLDAFGHVSVRHDTQPDRFLLARNMAPGQVR